ncbi:hypothetical protein EHI8A_217300 [Entamoeba histolytica HM-1:IMSS-B]|uniref:Uncharacterized protein n=6 Tax=Entamoeba histolytica TaxID=5759 RepID=C4M3Q7_ENTH1|nr:hypothetical protein EHI_146130 [Entamoeba histolytica HM-1:IMSS]EMD45575.1 Hypothetical protein EHI5A_244480 [Entamoeba histolytica KU27]EMH76282.1 hypothetical protein EHI8A_217300 [Entamoeba histolytica HM-1:IMSS-B]EMS10866.1 hypothetical protein KM1_290380 [Entamoeba histolytica HM-3:IMSS]ENY65100.1 hypothetical protein EHI7A_187000 [Entamoeba histolytica HM-1:IMSS-A]GAT95962.1 hypothetical protein CL6EHI_146130 [Entamoeba histolytica]|eukprot:XP_649885.1 hypothetical protein EHI_146130 [Entamoeba histolytica HM-1:IMSS]
MQQDGFLIETFESFAEAFCNIPQHKREPNPIDNYLNVPVWDYNYTEQGIVKLTKQIKLHDGVLYDSLTVLELIFQLQAKVQIQCQGIWYKVIVKKIIEELYDYFIFLLDSPLHHGEEIIMLQPPFA